MEPRTTYLHVILAGLATACSSGGGDGGTPTGVFLDSAVSGVDFSSGSLAGTTGPDGRFGYNPGQAVLFSIGDVVLGVADLGRPVLTPVDLISGAVDEQDEGVTNIARFLQTIDLDQDASNGIEVADAVRLAAVNVTMDFTQPVDDFETNEQGNVDLLTAGLPGGARTLIPAQQARDHLANTLRTVVAGRYDGNYTGDDAGPFSVYVDREGVLFGWAVSPSDGVIALTGSATTDGGFLAGNASTGATFMGQIEGDGRLAGTWELLPDVGTFQGTRTISLAHGLDEDLIDMLEGTYTGTFTSNFGSEPFTAGLDADGNLSLPPPDDQISGTIVSTGATTASFRGLTDEGCQLQGTVGLDGSFDGSFRNDLTGEVGTFTGMRL